MSSEGKGSQFRAGRRLASVATSVLALVFTGQAVGRNSTQVPAPAGITTLVLNGTHRIGLASRVSGKLASLGIDTRQLQQGWVADAPYQVRLTTIFVDGMQQRASAAGRTLQRLLATGAEVKSMPLQIRRYADRARDPMTVIVLGSSYHGPS